MSVRSPGMDRIERNCKARQIRHQLKQINPANSHSQTQSPLFSKIPPEIRNQIFTLAVSQHDTPRSPSEAMDEWMYDLTLAGLRYLENPRRIYTQLLTTCRLVYYETNSIPMASAVHLLPKMSAPKPFGYSHDESKTWINHLTSKNVAELNHVHCLGELCDWQEYMRLPQFQPRQVTYTLPSHNQVWKADCPLSLQGSLAKATTIVLPASLQAYNFVFYSHVDTRTNFDIQRGKLPDLCTTTLQDGRVLKTSLKEAKITLCGERYYVASFLFNENGTRGEPGSRRTEPLKLTKIPIHRNKSRPSLAEKIAEPQL